MMKNKIATKDITLANMNVWFGLDCRGIIKFGEYETDRIRAARFNNLTDGFKNQQPDVIGIQEANPLPAYIKKLSSALGYDISLKARKNLVESIRKSNMRRQQEIARIIDFIFLSHQFDPDMIKNVDLIFTRPTGGLFASDHLGLKAVLKQLP